MSLMNGLSQMGGAISDYASKVGIEQQKSDLEMQQIQLQNTLAGQRESAGRQETGAINATAATVQAQRVRDQTSFENQLPMTAAQTATNKVQQQEADARTIDANKPISGGYTGSFLVRGDDGQWKVQSAATGSAPITIDPNSNNLSSQTGLSDQALKLATGQMKGQRLSAQQSMMLEKEITDWGIKNNANTSTLVPQAEAAFHILQNNIQRNNQGTILEKEISGSIENAAQLADDIGQGRIKMADVLNVWAGKQTNDPQTIQAADQLGRLRSELAGYNAVAGGHLMQNGTPEPTPGDFREAETIISNGINAGGLKALSDSIHMSAVKNRNVLEGSIDDANKSYYSLFGAEYHPPNRAADQLGGGAKSANQPSNATVKTPPLPPSVPSGSQYSATLDQWRDPSGNLYNADGSEAK